MYLKSIRKRGGRRLKKKNGNIASMAYSRKLLDESALTLLSLNAPTEVVKQIIINIEAGVEVEVTIAA